MKNFLITESEKKRILEMHINATRSQYIKEAVSAPEPILKASSETSAVFLQTNLPVGSSKITDQEKKDEFLSKAAQIIKDSKDTIAQFYNDKTYKLPQFIKIRVGTDALGSESANTTVARDRLDAARQLVYEAFRKSGLGYNDTEIEKWITTSYNYTPSQLDQNLKDKNKVGNRPNERYIRVSISPVITKGLSTQEITSVEKNADDAYVDFTRFNIDEDEIANQICKLETFSDITDLDDRFQEDIDYGSLQGFLNKKMYDNILSNESQRKKIQRCLNRASQRSQKGDVAQIVSDMFTIDLNK